MSAIQIVGAVSGFLIIAVTLWQLIRNGIARSNGKVPGIEDAWSAPSHDLHP